MNRNININDMNNKNSYYNPEIETTERGDLESLIDEKVRYTVKYAYENSKYYRKLFEINNIEISSIKTHEDLKELPIISGDVIKRHQPPVRKNFDFKSTDDISSIQYMKQVEPQELQNLFS